MESLIFVVLICFSFILGWFLKGKTFPKKVGTLIVTKDEDGTYLSLQVSDMSYLESNKEVRLKVSQK